jgi:hypothetical protein
MIPILVSIKTILQDGISIIRVTSQLNQSVDIPPQGVSRA